MDGKLPRTPRLAFTLIELLIVVAIIAILAAIAVPNFLEAQIRAKVSRVKTEMRTMATAVEAYRIDNDSYVETFTPPNVLTTPIAYISDLPADIFNVHKPDLPDFFKPFEYYFSRYGYGAMPILNPSRYVFASLGPDTDLDTSADGTVDPFALKFYPGWHPYLVTQQGAFVQDGTVVGIPDPDMPDISNGIYVSYIPYDPTNGTVSSGDLYRASDHIFE